MFECAELVCDVASADVRKKAGDWVKDVRSRLKTPDKSKDDPLPLDDSAKKTRRKFVKYFSHFVLLKLAIVKRWKPVLHNFHAEYCFTAVNLEKERKGKEAYLYSAFYILCISQSAQTWITQFYLQIHHACVSFVCVHQMAPPLTEVRDI